MAATFQHEYKGKVIAIRETDGFVNATQMCKAGKMKFSNWYRLTITKEKIKTLEKELKQQVIEVSRGGNHRGSWIHPRLATCLAQWISPLFELEVSGWVEEWRMVQENNQRYIQALQELKPSPNVQAEREVQERLQQELGGLIEEETPVGFIDLLTDDEIIEIKNVADWKQGMGQLLCYAKFHPTKRKRLHLFNSSDYRDKKAIEYICVDYNIAVTYE